MCVLLSVHGFTKDTTIAIATTDREELASRVLEHVCQDAPGQCRRKNAESVTDLSVQWDPGH